MTNEPHGMVVRFWGGPDDGKQFMCSEYLRFMAPPKRYAAKPNYRRSETAQHGDESFCYVVYTWHERTEGS